MANSSAKISTSQRMDKSTCFLVFSDDWGEHPSSCQHLFRYISEDHSTLWVNTIGMRSPKLNLTDLKKAWKKIRKMIGRKQKTQTHQQHIAVEVVSPFMLPYAQLTPVRMFNKWSVIFSVRRKLKQLGMGHPIFVATVPNACDYVGYFEEKKTVYYCVDDFAHWPGHDKGYITSLEASLCAKVDLFIATSQNLFDRLVKIGKPTHLLTHGVDVEHFSNLPEAEHGCLNNIPKPRVGYFGLIDERLDQELLLQVAKALSDVSFVLTGSVEVDCSKLQDLSNIHFTGPVAYKWLPSVLTGLDVCMLPYKLDELSQSINPLKLKEYMASGKPIICTSLPALLEMQQYIQLADNDAEWSRVIVALTSVTLNNHETFAVEAREQFIQAEAWHVKACEFSSMVGEL